MRLFLSANPRMISCELSVSYSMHETIRGKMINLHQGVGVVSFLGIHLAKRSGRCKT